MPERGGPAPLVSAGPDSVEPPLTALAATQPPRPGAPEHPAMVAPPKPQLALAGDVPAVSALPRSVNLEGLVEAMWKL